MNARNVSITLIGPGAAGKTTIGLLIAKQLGIPFVDLDQRFKVRSGDIGEYIDLFGYGAYARENVETYNSVLGEERSPRVIALSSGFMTYPQDIHPDYTRLCQTIEEGHTTFVLIPSLDTEACVAETVRRQLERPFARSAAKEEAVIRERFLIYVGLRARKIETMRPRRAVVDELLVALQARRFKAPRSLSASESNEAAAVVPTATDLRQSPSRPVGRRWEITEIAQRLGPQRQRR